MKTLLLNLPFNIYNAYENTHLLPPFGMAMLSSFLKERGLDITFHDAAAHFMSRNNIIKYIEELAPQVLGLSLVTHQIPQAIPLLRDIKNCLPSVITIIGGAHASVDYRNLVLHKEIDIAVIGEGEFTMNEVLGCIQKGDTLEQVKGIAYYQNHDVKVNSSRELIQDINELPFADWASLPMNKYWYNYTIKKNYTIIVFSRGCPYACTFCAKSVTGKTQRRRTPERAVEELELLYKKYGVRDLLFGDAIFNMDNQWVSEICEGIIKANIPIVWGCQIRADRIDRKTLRLMKKSGCKKIFIGVESADNRMLKRMKKGETIEQMEEGIKIMQEEGFYPDLGFIIGMPGETEESIQKTIAFDKKYKKCVSAWNLAIPFPGTEFYDTAKKEGFLVEDWSKFTLYDLAYIPKDLTKEKLQHYYKQAVKSSYLSLSFLINQVRQVKSWTNFKIRLMIAYRIFFKRLCKLNQ